MAGENNAVRAVDKDKEKPRERSPNFPSITLTDAIKLAQALWAKEKRTAVTPEVAVTAWDYKGLSGPARSTLGALRQYGLLEGDSEGVRLSDLAMEILHQPVGSDERARAVRTAALNPRLFRDLLETHVEASDDALRAHLLTRLSFSDEGARRFVRAFRDVVALANLGGSGYGAGGMTTQGEATTGPTKDAGTVGGQAYGKPKVTMFSWPLAKGLTAEVRFVGDDVRPAHIELLSKYLELAKAAVSSDRSESDGDDT
jgi:hypothetical protein